MENNAYQLFINQVMVLAETIVIKSPDAALSLNRFVTDYYGSEAVDTLDPTTWKYYKNIAGEYHLVDTMMTVVSLDTRETVNFTRENLLVHRATANGYLYGTRLYKELVSRYPEQESLILGILYPVNKDEAIAAKDGAILGFPKGLVEVNEYSLIAKLQGWIDGFLVRWVNRQFNYSDSLYAATWMGIMYANLVPAILTFRLEACRTNEAHSFHVHQYLASHGIDESYTEMLTLKQSLWLYRNIEYIEQNTGTQENFEWLVQNLLTERRIPLAEFTMRHDVSNFPNDLYPTLKFRRKTLNASTSTDSLRSLSLEQVLEKENKFARSNEKYMHDLMPGIKSDMENSKSNVIMTKFLESSLVDRTNNTPYTMSDTLMNHWLYLSSIGRYTAFISAVNPKTGERIPLSVKDAFVFVWYSFCKSNGLIIDDVPRMFAKRVQRLPKPTVDDLMSVVDPALVPVSIAEEILSYQPDIDTLLSTEAFHNKCIALHQCAQDQRGLIVSQEHAVRRGMVFGMVSRSYGDFSCSMTDGDITYADWFKDRNISIDDFTISDLGLLYVNIVREATGMSLSTTKSLKDLQAALIRILAALSSYSVQFNAEINTSDLMVTDWTAIRIGDIGVTGYSKHNDQSQSVGVLSSKVSGKTKVQVDLKPTFNDTDIEAYGNPIPVAFETTTDVRPYMQGLVTRLILNTAPVKIRPSVPLRRNIRGIVPVIGIDQYLKLPIQSQLDFGDMYGNDFVTEPPDSSDLILIPLKLALPIQELGGLKYDPTLVPGRIDLKNETRVRYLDAFEKS